MAKNTTLSGKKITMPFQWEGCSVAVVTGDEVHFPCKECEWALPGPEVKPNG
jgi:hypothetical protein